MTDETDDPRDLLTLRQQADRWERLLASAGITAEDCVPAYVALECLRGVDELSDVFTRRSAGETEAA